MIVKASPHLECPSLELHALMLWWEKLREILAAQIGPEPTCQLPGQLLLRVPCALAAAQYEHWILPRRVSRISRVSSVCRQNHVVRTARTSGVDSYNFKMSEAFHQFCLSQSAWVLCKISRKKMWVVLQSDSSDPFLDFYFKMKL